MEKVTVIHLATIFEIVQNTPNPYAPRAPGWKCWKYNQRLTINIILRREKAYGRQRSRLAAGKPVKHPLLIRDLEAEMEDYTYWMLLTGETATQFKAPTIEAYLLHHPQADTTENVLETEQSSDCAG